MMTLPWSGSISWRSFAVSFSKRNQAVLVLGLWMSAFLTSAGRAQDRFAANQQLADDVARALQQTGRLKHFHVDIEVVDGAVELHGKVADVGQRDEAVRLARAVPGVRQVRDRLLVLNDKSILPVQAQDQPEVAPPPRRIEQAPVAPAPSAVLPNIPSNCPIDPLPFNPSCPNDQFMKPPPMPPYAWPTYAPYNNYSRVAYPSLYPQDAFPGIGPFYPFPKVPLGWRSVTLTWQDGYWYYGKGVNSHDWWRVRYK
jgi:BON domain